MIGLLRGYLAPYKGALTVVVVLLALQTMANLYLPYLNADIINNGVVTGDTSYILRVGGLMLLISLLTVVAAVFSTYYSSRTAMSVGRDMRGSLFRRVERFSLAEMGSFGAPSLITRNTNDVQQVQMLVLLGLTVMIMAPLTMIGGVIMAMRTDLALSTLMFIVVPLMMAFIAVIVRTAVPLFRSMQVKIDRINGVLRENLAGIRVIRAFVRTEHEERRFTEANDDLTVTALKVTRLFAVMPATIMLFLNLTSVAVIWFGGHLVAEGDMQIGDLTAFLSYAMQILMSVMMAVMLVVAWPRAAASAERISAVLDTEPAIHDPVDAAPSPARLGRIEFRDVDFGYPGAQDLVLRGVSFTVEPGRVTAVVGSTGSGKTTLMTLIPRLHDVTGGAVLVDGVDVRELGQQDLWSRLGYVPQRSFLFSGTVASNLRFGHPTATDPELWHALEVAQAADFVRAMPDGIESPIEQGGTNVSGGQRQRLSIARALVRRPPLYLFDDSFSALDFATDARLRAALREDTGDAAVLVVAQRVSTIMTADQIVVLDDGAVVGIGAHDELMTTCPTYREIVFSQLSAEEVA